TPGGRLQELSGLTLDLRLALLAPGGKRLFEVTGSTLLTHFGLSGPAPMNLSRHIARFRLENPGASPTVVIGHPDFSTPERADTWLKEQAASNPRRTAAVALTELFPERLARLLAEGYGRLGDLTRADRL